MPVACGKWGHRRVRGWRLFRAAVFAVVASQLAAMGHLLGGGHLPDVTVLITVAVFLGGSLSGLARRRRPGWQIFLGMLASQLAFHTAFEVTAHHDGPMNAARMLVFHLFAAMAASWLMAGGESMLFRLFAALHRVLAPLRRIPAIAFPPNWTAVISGDAAGGRLRVPEVSVVSRRGPPLTT